MKQTGEIPAEEAGTSTPCAQDHVTIDARERYGQGMRWKLGFNTLPCIQSRRGTWCLFDGDEFVPIIEEQRQQGIP
jgi:hypothetical protein